MHKSVIPLLTAFDSLGDQVSRFIDQAQEIAAGKRLTEV